MPKQYSALVGTTAGRSTTRRVPRLANLRTRSLIAVPPCFRDPAGAAMSNSGRSGSWALRSSHRERPRTKGGVRLRATAGRAGAAGSHHDRREPTCGKRARRATRPTLMWLSRGRMTPARRAVGGWVWLGARASRGSDDREALLRRRRVGAGGVERAHLERVLAGLQVLVGLRRAAGRERRLRRPDERALKARSRADRLS
jgi:hypothetical protein